MLMICGEYVEIMLIFAQYSIHILSNQQLVTSTTRRLGRPWSSHRVSGPLGLLRLFFEGAVVKTAGGIYVLRGESAK